MTLKCYSLNSLLSGVSLITFIHPLKSRRLSLFNPSLVSHFLHGNACHIVFLLHNVPPPHTTRATINPSLPPAFIHRCSPHLLPTALHFCPTLWFPTHLHGRGFAVTSGSQPVLMTETDTQALNKEQTDCIPSLHYFPPTSWFFLQTQRVLPTNVLQLLPHFTAQFWTLHQPCSTAQISTQLNISSLASFASYCSSHCCFPDMHLLAAAREDP